MIELLVRQAGEHALDDDADERLRMERRARDEVVEEAAHRVAQLVIFLQEVQAAVILRLDDVGQPAAQQRQMLFDGIDLTRGVGLKMVAHVCCRPPHDLLDWQVGHEAVAQLVHELMELRLGVEHGRLLVEELQHILLQLRVARAELLEHRHELLLHDVGRIFEVDEVHGLSQPRQEERQRALGLLLLVLLEHRLDGLGRLRPLSPHVQISRDALEEVLVAPALLQPVADICEEILRLHRAQVSADAPRKLRRPLLAVLLQKETARVVVEMVRDLGPRVGLAEPLHEHRHEVQALQVAEHLAPREELLLDHRHRGLDEGLAPPRQDGRMIREAERLAEECRDGKPVGDAADERRFRAEEEPRGKDRVRKLQVHE